MKEILLCKYGEIVLKGQNRQHFEQLLEKELKKRLKTAGSFSVSHAQSTIYIEALDENADFEEAFRIAGKVFGFVSVARAAVAEKNMDDILRVTSEYIPRFLDGCRTFKCDARRADKRFPLNSPQIAARVGETILEAVPGIKVDLDSPDIVVMTEIRERNAYIHAGSVSGAGGMPVSSNGKALLLLSGGIDSPVAGYMMAKRGVYIEALHFESYPYTSEQARDKVIELAEIVAGYSGYMRVNIVSLTRLQETLRDSCNEEYFTLLLRRSMMRIAERVANERYAQALVTGESVGQVASQTMHALTVTDCAVNMPVFRPCIGMDKEEIIAIARKIGTFETSILPYEDCCTVFTPRHPKTRPEIGRVLEQENRYDWRGLEDDALSSLYYITTDPYDLSGGNTQT
ncbi:MAG: tRNA 4-thiouridine(8) synthase ThiI [Clostridia bacterium]|nr:tRNA 4-thiouridine(8) synthase ThiI [Clostridia bacterium]